MKPGREPVPGAHTLGQAPPMPKNGCRLGLRPMLWHDMCLSHPEILRRIPKDPMTDSYDWGLRSYQDDFDSDAWGEENVYDVYTKSPAVALDGTKYKDW